MLQEALLGAWKTVSRFDPQRGSVRTWLLAITANQAKKALRSWRPTGYQSRGDARATPDMRIDLERAVSDLPKRQRLAIELFYFVGLPIDEVAVVMGCAEGTVKSTLSAARRNLQGILGKEYDE